MVSVIIPAFNVEQYIKRCLDSVVEQTYNDMEVLLINDGSTDQTAEICEKFAAFDKRIRYYKTENQGRAEARNYGIKKAKGEYITFLDADDWWDKNFIKIMVNTLESVKESADFAVCDIIYVDSKTGAKTESEIRISEEKVLSIENNADLINKCRTFLWGKIYKRNLFTDNGFYLAEGVMEDFPLVPLLAAKARGVIRVPYKLQYYFRNRAGNSSDNAESIRQDYIGGIAKLIENFKAHGFWESLYEPLYKLAYSQARFALKQTIRLVELKKAESTDIDELKKELILLLSKHWEKELLFDKRFAWRGDEALKEGLKRLVVTENQIVDETETYDYLITDSMIKHTKLHGENLYWDIADTIFYQISQERIK